jgi:formylglycine-generating enzyme required for sulfatase activity
MADTGAGEKLKVFISYSRRDSAAFADELLAGLEVAGFAPFLDRHDIAPGEPWEARLGGLIEQSDTVVFVVSPEAIKSDRCVWEVDKTLALSKRLLPVIHISVPDNLIPEKLSRLQFVRFDAGRGVTRPLAELADALRQDLDWIRDHTRLGEIATRWDKRGRPESLLLRGDDIAGAKKWMADRNAAAPAITDAQRAFVKASEEAESARLDKEREQLKETVRQQRRIAWLLGGVAVLMGGSILGLIAWINQSYLEQLWNAYMREGPYKKAEFQPHILSAERERALKPKETFRECEKDCPEMVFIPAGSFMMGSPESETGRLAHEGPQHEVTIAKPFAVSKFEVTWEEWDACAKYRGCPQDIPDSAWGHDKRPVINVTWEQIQQYVTWLSKMTGKSYRLLTEAEWEYAARAGANTAYSWGDEIGEGNANCSGCGSQWEDVQTAPVGSFAANAFGLHDMHGNVWEWVEDCYQSNYDGAPTDGSARLSPDCTNPVNHVVRGGSWVAWQVPRSGRSAPGGSWVWVQVPQPARSASRENYAKDNLRSFIGFRVARTLTP